MADALAQLLEDGIIEEVVARLKSGKEADIYLVQHAGEIVAAKVYKERHARNFRNNAAYKEGRQVRNTRTQRAMDKGSRFGQAASEEAWKAKESEALSTLFAAGVRVPQPVLFYEGVLLMEAVVDAEGHPAPRLIDAPIPRERAAELYADVRQQMVKILCCDLIHGDLSPYNVLSAWNGPTVIDFPQVIGAAHNNQAERFFTRDLSTVRRFFASLDPSLHSRGGDGAEIWRAYQRRELTPDFVPAGRAEHRGPPAHARHPHAQGHEARRPEGHAPRNGNNGRDARGFRPDRAPKNRSGGKGRKGPPPERRGPPPRGQRGSPGPAVSYVDRPPRPPNVAEPARGSAEAQAQRPLNPAPDERD